MSQICLQKKTLILKLYQKSNIDLPDKFIKFQKNLTKTFKKARDIIDKLIVRGGPIWSC